jgi:LacI family gluconate utilization system Gnt-I transcriptional repressor
VAKLAGVSPMTASRALSRSSLVAPETAQRVKAAAGKLAYVPNRLAGGLASSKSSIISLVIPSTQDPVFQELIQSLRNALLASDYHMFLGLSDYDQSREADLLDAIVGRRPDGIVLTGVLHSPELRWRLQSSHIPVVETWDLTPTPIDMLVGFSNEKVGRAAAEHLIQRGCRKLALIIGDDLRSLQRRDGFVAAAAERGVAAPRPETIQAPSTMGHARQACARLLASDPGIDGIFCSSDQIAMGVLFEAIARGIQVPGKLAVMGFGNFSASADTHPSLSTVAVDGALIGRETARLLMERINAPEPAEELPPKIVDVGFRIIARDSA